jgi:nitroreductase
MEFFEVLKARQSVRAFAPSPVEEEKLGAILEAARSAPSAGNLQAYEIYLVKADRLKRALARAALDQYFLAQAPVALVFCANPARSERRYKERGARLYSVQDATIACTYAMLAATALGLATVWIGAFHDAAVSRAIGLPEDIVPVAILPIGYAAEKPEPTSRRPLDELVHAVE